MAFESLSRNIEEVVELVKTYSQTNLEYYKLKAIREVSNLAKGLFKRLMLLIMIPFSLIFLSVALALLIGHSLGSHAAGFAIVGAFHLLLTLFFVIWGPKWIQKSIITELSQRLFKNKK